MSDISKRYDIMTGAETCMSMLTYLKNINIKTLIVNHACQTRHIRKCDDMQ